MTEFAADRIVHVIGVALGLPAALVIVTLAVAGDAPGQAVPVMLYAGGLVAMLSCSAAYNLARASRYRDWLRRFDHAAIFAMIAGSYTPFTVRLGHGWSEGLTTAIWTVAALGIAVKLCRPLWHAKSLAALSTLLYLSLGWIGVVAIDPFTAHLPARTLLLLAAGGAIYTSGVIFHHWQRLRYQNAIWHGFVLMAACVHYIAVLTVIDTPG
jgi:hemolysin III